MTEKIAYICDRQKCPRCSPDCMHTTDIRHAYLFKLQDGTDDTWFEESTIDVVVPVRHGRFVGTEFDGYADDYPVYYEWKCSECGCVFEDEEPNFKYCPNCGARMDKDE